MDEFSNPAASLDPPQRRQVPDGESGAANERIAEVLASRILAGDLKPGARIKQDEVAAEFNASRIPVREALRILSARGLVTVRTNSGAWVTEMTLRDLEISYEVRESVEPILLRDSMLTLSGAAIERMRNAQDRIDAGVDVREFLVLDREFHWASYSGSSADQLRTMVARLWDTTQSYRRAFMDLNRDQGAWIVNAEHRLLLEAVERRDADAASDVLALHIRRTRNALQSHPEVFGTTA